MSHLPYTTEPSDAAPSGDTFYYYPEGQFPQLADERIALTRDSLIHLYGPDDEAILPVIVMKHAKTAVAQSDAALQHADVRAIAHARKWLWCSTKPGRISGSLLDDVPPSPSSPPSPREPESGSGGDAAPVSVAPA